jgi:hypothetical protein
MVLDWFSGNEGSVEDLIAKKKYKRAIEVLRAEFKKGSRDPRLRQQLADVLVLAGRGREAVPVLAGLADEYARAGFAAKGIAVLKRIEKIEPGRADVAKKLAGLIEAKGAPPAAAAPAPDHFREIGISLPVRDSTPTSTWDSSAAPASSGSEPALPAVALPAAAPPLAAPPPAAEEAALVEPLDDLDLSLDALVPPEPSVGEVVRSPLFSDFSAGELLAVMGGLELLTFDAGDIIITEGEPGRSLFVVSSGRVKAFVRNPAGRHVQVREMDEGAFFGEISILQGGPRTATVTAATRVDLLELDRDTLDGITARYPRVLQVLEAFYRERAGSADEAVVRNMTFGAGSSS